MTSEDYNKKSTELLEKAYAAGITRDGLGGDLIDEIAKHLEPRGLSKRIIDEELIRLAPLSSAQCYFDNVCRSINISGLPSLSLKYLDVSDINSATRVLITRRALHKKSDVELWDRAVNGHRDMLKCIKQNKIKLDIFLAPVPFEMPAFDSLPNLLDQVMQDSEYIKGNGTTDRVRAHLHCNTVASSIRVIQEKRNGISTHPKAQRFRVMWEERNGKA